MEQVAAVFLCRFRRNTAYRSLYAAIGVRLVILILCRQIGELIAPRSIFGVGNDILTSQIYRNNLLSFAVSAHAWQTARPGSGCLIILANLVVINYNVVPCIPSVCGTLQLNSDFFRPKIVFVITI